MDVTRYLARLGLEAPPPYGLAGLAALQRAHLLALPFENLDVLAGRAIELDLARIFDKVVGERRGGYCYELNGLFAWLLEQLGYPVERLEGRVWAPGGGGPGEPFDHCTLRVTLDQPYLVDVAFAHFTPPSPLRLPDGEVCEGRTSWHAVPPVDGVARLEMTVDGRRGPVLDFTTVPRELEDYAARNEYMQYDQASFFRQHLLATRMTPVGRLILFGGTFSRVTAAGRDERPVTEEELPALLRDEFGLEVPAAFTPA